jgi:phosphatidate cytidylyltransferase
MARVLSALVLLPVVLGIVWFAPWWGTLMLALVVLTLAHAEYVHLVERPGQTLPRVWMLAASLAACAAFGMPGSAIAPSLLAAFVVLGAAAVAAGSPEEDVARRVGVSTFPVLYLGLPVGALAAVRTDFGPSALLALLFTVMLSDTAQYYGGRRFGRTLLAPTISPKKTREGAAFGFLAGAVGLGALGSLWLPAIPLPLLVLAGATIVALGIVGDLFESLLKRSANLKDSSGLIPGHGGMLDRIDSLLFAAPVFYLLLEYASPRAGWVP